MIKYGKSFRKDHLYYEGDFIPVNNGSCGTIPKKILELLESVNRKMFANPDYWMIFKQFSQFQDQLKAIAKYLQTQPEQLFFIDTCTAGVNAVFKTLNIQKGDKILITNIEYGSIQETVNFAQKQLEIQPIWVIMDKQSLQCPKKILTKFQEQIDKNPDIKLCIVDHITPMPCCLFPIQDIVQLCKDNKILTLVDGVQATGQVDFNIDQIDPDFYILNWYKWCFAPIGTNSIWVSKKHLNIYEPAFASYFQQDPSQQRKFHWQGMRITTAWNCVGEALKFFQENDPQGMRKYGHDLVIAGSKRMAEILETEVLIENEQNIPCMAQVRLPVKNIEEGNTINFYLLENSIAFMRVFEFDGLVYGRISAWGYNELQDYEKLAHKILEIQRMQQKQNE